MADTQYEVEYAKTGNSTCKICKEKIDKGLIRFGILVPSAFFDKKQMHWHHEDCFFEKKILSDISELAKFNLLKYEDQTRIRSKITSLLTSVIPETSGSVKRSIDDNSPIISGLSIEYSSTSSATCRFCNVKICKGDIRISKSEYDPRFGDSPKWYHVECFARKRQELLFFTSGENLPGFETLKEEDRSMIRSKLTNLDVQALAKKIKMKINEEKNLTSDEEFMIKMAEQSKLFDSYRQGLNLLNKKELKELLEINNQEVPTSRDECLDRLADCMAFGVPKRCPECQQGQIILDNFGYKCIGDMTAWTQCFYTSQEPEKEALKIPDNLKSHTLFKDFEGKITHRLFLPKPLSGTLSFEDDNVDEEMCYPLKNLQFYLYGKFKIPKENLKNRILKIGGLVVSKLTKTTAAVVSSKEEVDKMSNVMKEIENHDIEVIEETFFDLVDCINGTVSDSLRLIKENNIAKWGSDPTKRIPQEVLDGRSIGKSGNIYLSTSKPSTSKLKIRDGTAVDPESGLEDTTHVYKDTSNVYSIVLSKFNIDDNTNSYYKLQLLESNMAEEYWIFRSWGRIGTSIGGNKLKKFSSLQEAKDKFNAVYLDKARCQWTSDSKFVKIPRAYTRVDVSYGDIPQSAINIDNDSTLPISVQKLIIRIFDTEIMTKTLLEYELDTEKMPLGKLSKRQIYLGYEVLSHLLEKFEDGSHSDIIIKESSNKFYTFIPHNFGTASPQLLKDVDIVKKKIEMLDNLLEIEIAYKLLQSPSDDSVSIIESHYNKLKADITPIEKSSDNFKLIKEYIKNTHAPTHKNYMLEVEEIFEIVREGEYERYEKFKKLHNKRLLWHGSRVTNLAGILSQGLRIAPPQAPVTGYMFGKGVYFADMCSKSANYCNVKNNNPTGFLLLCEVALGNMKECYKAEFVRNLPNGIHSVWGVGQTQPDHAQYITIDNDVIVPLGSPLSMKIRSDLLYNEFIVYDVAQINVKYLVQVNFNFK